MCLEAVWAPSEVAILAPLYSAPMPYCRGTPVTDILTRGVGHLEGLEVVATETRLVLHLHLLSLVPGTGVLVRAQRLGGIRLMPACALRAGSCLALHAPPDAAPVWTQVSTSGASSAFGH